MQVLWKLIVGALIGSLAGFLSSRKIPMGIVGNIIAGLIGASIGESIFGAFGPSVAGMALIPSILGAVILVFITSIFIRSMNK